MYMVQYDTITIGSLLLPSSSPPLLLLLLVLLHPLLLLLPRASSIKALSCPSQARVVLYKDVAAILQITFNAINRDSSNWFSMSRLIDSPWTDMESESKALFAINGKGRSFHISKTFDSCTRDEGWLTVTNPTSCTWEQRKGRGTVVYSNTHHYTNWNSPSEPGT